MNQFSSSFLLKIQPIKPKHAPLGPERIKMAEITKPSSNSKILHSQVQTKKMAKMLRVGHTGN